GLPHRHVQSAAVWPAVGLLRAQGRAALACIRWAGRRRADKDMPSTKECSAGDDRMKVRRVITGHDANAKAVVMIDEVIDNPKVGRPGALVSPVWVTEGFPVDNDGDDDAARRKTGTTVPNGTACRVIEFKPGVQARNHRTSSIDYAIVVSGEIDMEM